jgi:hypothetical protein
MILSRLKNDMITSLNVLIDSLNGVIFTGDKNLVKGYLISVVIALSGSYFISLNPRNHQRVAGIRLYNVGLLNNNRGLLNCCVRSTSNIAAVGLWRILIANKNNVPISGCPA